MALLSDDRRAKKGSKFQERPADEEEGQEGTVVPGFRALGLLTA